MKCTKLFVFLLIIAFQGYAQQERPTHEMHAMMLYITDSYNLGQMGSGINSKVIDGKLKFELNQVSVNGANLKVSGQLSSMAIVI